MQQILFWLIDWLDRLICEIMCDRDREPLHRIIITIQPDGTDFALSFECTTLNRRVPCSFSTFPTGVPSPVCPRGSRMSKRTPPTSTCRSFSWATRPIWRTVGRWVRRRHKSLLATTVSCTWKRVQRRDWTLNGCFWRRRDAKSLSNCWSRVVQMWMHWMKMYDSVRICLFYLFIYESSSPVSFGKPHDNVLWIGLTFHLLFVLSMFIQTEYTITLGSTRGEFRYCWTVDQTRSQCECTEWTCMCFELLNHFLCVDLVYKHQMLVHSVWQELISFLHFKLLQIIWLNCLWFENNRQNCTPLHLAVWCGHCEVVELLIKSGANVNAQNDDVCLMSW